MTGFLTAPARAEFEATFGETPSEDAATGMYFIRLHAGIDPDQVWVYFRESTGSITVHWERDGHPLVHVERDGATEMRIVSGKDATAVEFRFESPTADGLLRVDISPTVAFRNSEFAR